MIAALVIRPTEGTGVGKIMSVVATSKFLCCSGVQGYVIDLQRFRVVRFSWNYTCVDLRSLNSRKRFFQSSCAQDIIKHAFTYV
jgi:hypothetical protein